MKSDVSRPVFPRLRQMALLALPAVLLAAGGLMGAQDDGGARVERGANQPVRGQTEPSKEMELAFPLMGQVNEVLVKEGDRVEAGQVLIKQDFAADEARLKGLEAKADVTVLVKLAEAQHELAKVEHEIAKAGGDAYQPIEVRRLKLDVELSATRIDEQKRQGLIDSFAADEQRIMIDYKQLRSPASGYVEKVEAAVGEVFGPQTPALKVVTIDPLNVLVLIAEAPRVMRLAVGDTVHVQYVGEEEWRDAKVTFISPVGEAGKLRFKAELPNPEGRPAGLPVNVRLP